MIDKRIRLVPAKQRESDLTFADLLEAPDAFFLEINVADVLEVSEDPQTLSTICNKIRKGGKLILTGVDGLDICRQVYFGLMPLHDAAANFFKHASYLYSVGVLKEYFLNMKWDIQFIGLSEGRYLIEVVKP
jgi:hypothetical protein